MKTAIEAREDLKVIRDQTKALRAERAEADREVQSAREAFKADDIDGKFMDSPEFKAVENAVAKRGDIDDKLADREKAEKVILSLLGENDNKNAGADVNRSFETLSNGRWNGHALLAQSDDFKLAKEAGMFTSGHRFGTVNIGQIADRDTFLAALPAATPGDISSGVGIVVPDNRGIVSPALKRLSLLQLIPTGTTDSNIVEYVQVTAIPLSAAETAELAVKPQDGMQTVDATAPVRTIAGWVKLSRQSMDDVAGLGTLINTLLPYDVQRRIESQMLSGDGTGQNLLGLLNTTGIGDPAAVPADNTADAILRAITTIILSDSDPDFVAMNPVTWQNLLLMKAQAADGSWTGQYLYGSPGVVQAPTIWGLTITANRTVPSATPLVGDSMGATLLVREGVNVKTSDSDQDDFVRNRVTLLAEARVAFAVWRPSAFSLANVPAT
jgi:HK97 family phage major capsid protein